MVATKPAYWRPATGLAILGISLLHVPALAQQTPPPADPKPLPWMIGPVNFSGMVDTYFNYTPNHPESRFLLYRNFDVRANSFSLNMAQFQLAMDPQPVGFTLTLGAGRAWDLFNFADTANGFDNMRYVPQAFVSFRPSGLGGSQFDFGKFYTSAGAELTETHLAWNYSRSLMYANGPYYHFGLRTTYPIGQHFTAGFQLVNGWNNVEDNNSAKTVGVTSAVTFDKISWFNTYYGGTETSEFNEGFRNFNSSVVNFTPSEKFNAYVQFDYGTEKVRTGGSFDWIAVGGAARIQLAEKLAVIPRIEYYYDKDGFITGVGQKLNEFTITGEYKFWDNFFTRLEYRRDWSNQRVFERGAIPADVKSQSTFAIGFVAYFPPPAP
jgi:hypothetical protein